MTISNIGLDDGNNPPHKKTSINGGKIGEKTVEAISPEPTSSVTNEEDPRRVQLSQPISMGASIDLFNALRRSIPIGNKLRIFIDNYALTSQTSRGNKNSFRKIFEPDKNLVVELNLRFPSNDLALELEQVFHQTYDRRKAITLAKMIVSYCGEEEFTEKFIIPYLSTSEGEAGVGNRFFMIELVKAQESQKVYDILSKINYGEIEHPDIFADSLIHIITPQKALEILLDTIPSSDTYSSDEQTGKAIGAQQIAIAIFTGIIKRKETKQQNSLTTSKAKKILSGSSPEKKQVYLPDVLLGELIIFYKKTNCSSILEQVEKLILNHHPDPQEVFEKIAFSPSSDSTLDRLRHFNAINNWVVLARKNTNNEATVISGLVAIASMTTDPMLVSSACCTLTNHCGEAGYNALIKLISEDIKTETPSLPLFWLCQMILVNDNENHNKIFQRILAEQYDDKSNLAQAFQGLQSESFPNVYKDSNKKTRFSYENFERPKLLLDLIKHIGLQQFVSLSNVPVEQKISEPLDILINRRNNIISILKFAYTKFPQEIESLIRVSEALSDNRTEPKDSPLKRVAGMRHIYESDY